AARANVARFANCISVEFCMASLSPNCGWGTVDSAIGRYGSPPTKSRTQIRERGDETQGHRGLAANQGLDCWRRPMIASRNAETVVRQILLEKLADQSPTGRDSTAWSSLRPDSRVCLPTADSEPQPDARVHEKPRRLIVHSEAEPGANFEIGRHEIMEAGTDE